MATAYYSTTFPQSADDVWSVIRDFNNYAVWLPGTTSQIEDDKTGDAVGAVRSVQSSGRTIRQRLLALSDVERLQVYEFCGPAPFPVSNFQATLRVRPIIDANAAFVEWWATFDCASEERDHWTHHFAHEGFAKWLGSLRQHLADRGQPRSRVAHTR